MPLRDHARGTVRGTMVLTPIYTTTSTTTIFDYRVDDVNWLVRLNSSATTEQRVTGSGVLHRVWPSASGAQRLELDLKIDDQPVQHFDSGWVQPKVDFPQIDLTVSLKGMVCFDTVFQVAAAPVPVLEYHVDARSTHQVGCWAPCECPLQLPQPLSGRFGLVPIPATSSGTPWAVENEYAVVNVRWKVLGSAGVQTSYHGFGFYRRNLAGPWANPLPGQRMFLDLLTAKFADLIRFDSGVVPTLVAFPDINVRMSINGFMCFDTAIHLKAGPAWPVAFTPGAP